MTVADHDARCAAATFAADGTEYSDVMTGERWARVRRVCSAGHSVYEVVPLEPEPVRPIEPVRQGRLPARAVAITMPPPIDPTVTRPAQKARPGRKYHLIRDRAYAERIAAVWNDGMTAKDIAELLGMPSRHAATATITTMRQRFPDLEFRRGRA